MFIKSKAKDQSQEEYIKEEYGKTLFQQFFKPYTEKFLELKCSKIHKDWAKAGINRATISKQETSTSLFSLLKSVLMPEKKHQRFLYPKHGGIEVFIKRLVEQIEALGGRIILSDSILKVMMKEHKVVSVTTHEKREIECERLFWTGNIKDAANLFEQSKAVENLNYRSTILLNYIIGGKLKRGYQWCYYGSQEKDVYAKQIYFGEPREKRRCFVC